MGNPCRRLFCSRDGLTECKRAITFVSGALVVASAVLTIVANLSQSPPIILIRSTWNIIFGLLMMVMQLSLNMLITPHAGFLQHWFLRGVFYFFVGTNVMTCGEPCTPSDWLSIGVGSFCIFVGMLELLFGAKSKQPDRAGCKLNVAETVSGRVISAVENTS